MIKCAVLLICCLGFVSLGFAQESDLIDLKISLEVGDRYVIEKDSEKIIEQTMMEEQVQMAQQVSMKNALRVEAIDEQGIATLKTSLQSVQVFILSTGGQTQEYNSEDPEQEFSPLGKTYRPFLKKEFEVQLSPQGKVLAVTGVDEIFVQLFEDDDVHQLQNQEYVEKIKEMFGDKGVREMIENMFSVYPEEPVTQDDVWSSEYTLSNSLFPIKVKSQSRITEVGGGVATIEVDSELTSEIQDSDMTIEDVNVSYSIETGSQYSINRFFLDSGWVVSTETAQDIAAVMTMKMLNGAEDVPDELREITIPMTIQSNVKVSSKKVN